MTDGGQILRVHSWRAVVAASLLGGCAATRATETSPAQSAPTASATPAAAADGGASAAGVIVIPGGAACARDDECVLSGYGEGIDGCCDVESTCGMYATSKADLEARRRRNKCRRSDPPICPPMAPCSAPRYTLDRAACIRNVCAALAHAVTP